MVINLLVGGFDRGRRGGRRLARRRLRTCGPALRVGGGSSGAIAILAHQAVRRRGSTSIARGGGCASLGRFGSFVVRSVGLETRTGVAASFTLLGTTIALDLPIVGKDQSWSANGSI